MGQYGGGFDGYSGFVAAHGVHRQSDSQRETPDKRVAFSEVHKFISAFYLSLLLSA